MSSRLERVINLVKEINRGNYPTVNDLCNRFEIATRTLHDDIRFVKDRMRIEIVFDKSRAGYFNSTPEAKMPEFDLNEDEVLALMLGKEMLLEHSGTAFRTQLEEALNKIALRLVSKDTLSEEQLRALIQFIPGGVASTDGKLLRELKDACKKHHTIELEYFAAYNGETGVRKVDPYRIIEAQGAWYIVGWCHLRKEMRKFAIHRIKQCTVTRDKFEVQPGISVDEYIDSAFLLEHRQGEAQIVKIKFTPVGARFVLERHWHSTQKITTHSDGSCTLEFKTQSLDEVKRWVLPYGATAEVIEPQELRKRVMDELRRNFLSDNLSLPRKDGSDGLECN